MKATGKVRRIDDLGRVVIPKEIRRTMRIREEDLLCIIHTSKIGAVGADAHIRPFPQPKKPNRPNLIVRSVCCQSMLFSEFQRGSSIHLFELFAKIITIVKTARKSDF